MAAGPGQWGRGRRLYIRGRRARGSAALSVAGGGRGAARAGSSVVASVSGTDRASPPAPRGTLLSKQLFFVVYYYFFLPALPGDSGSSSGAFGLRGAMLVAEAAPAPGPAEKLGERFSVLTWEQVQRLDQILGEAVPIHGRGNFPTLSVRPRTIVQVRPGVAGGGTGRASPRRWTLPRCRGGQGENKTAEAAVTGPPGPEPAPPGSGQSSRPGAGPPGGAGGLKTGWGGRGTPSFCRCWVLCSRCWRPRWGWQVPPFVCSAAVLAEMLKSGGSLL